MRKAILLMSVLVTFPLVGLAQSVLGIEFGSSYQQTKKALEDRYGEHNVSEKESALYVFDLQMGNYYFNVARFEFQRDANGTYFNYAHFERRFSVNDIETAKTERDYLFGLIKEKYKDENASYINDQGFKCYWFGHNPKSIAPVGVVYLEKEKSRGGQTYLFLTLEYGPIYYIPKSSDF